MAEIKKIFLKTFCAPFIPLFSGWSARDKWDWVAMSKLWYFPNSSFRFIAFVNKKNETSLFFRILFCSINIEAVRFIFISWTAKHEKNRLRFVKKKFVSLHRSWGIMVQKFCFALHKKSFPSFLIRFVFDLEEFWSKNVGGTEVPQRTAYRDVPSQIAAHLKTRSPL